MTSSQNNPLRYCTITNATTILESTTDNEEFFSLITEGWLPENHNVAYDVTNTASKSSFSLNLCSSVLGLDAETTCIDSG